MKNPILTRGAAAMLVFFGAAMASSAAPAVDCDGTLLRDYGGVKRAMKLADGGIAAFSKLNINIDGYARAYHLKNADAGALIHLCNAGRVYLPDGRLYEGSQDNATCTGRFMEDVARIGAAGWNDPTVGVVEWYGILGTGAVKLRGRDIAHIIPVFQKDGSGFAVSPTKLEDTSIEDLSDQSRYVNPLRVPAAVVPRALLQAGVEMGSFGVAFDLKKRVAVPFVVGDSGPRIGEGSVALARLVAGLAPKDDIERGERFAGQVDSANVLWIFFKDTARGFDSHDEAATLRLAREAYATWGGEARLQACARKVPRN